MRTSEPEEQINQLQSQLVNVNSGEPTHRWLLSTIVAAAGVTVMGTLVFTLNEKRIEPPGVGGKVDAELQEEKEKPPTVEVPPVPPDDDPPDEPPPPDPQPSAPPDNTLCGKPGLEPEFLSADQWGQYGCSKDPSAGSLCLPRRVYSSQSGDGCSGRELCCGPSMSPPMIALSFGASSDRCGRGTPPPDRSAANWSQFRCVSPSESEAVCLSDARSVCPGTSCCARQPRSGLAGLLSYSPRDRKALHFRNNQANGRPIDPHDFWIQRNGPNDGVIFTRVSRADGSYYDFIQNAFIYEVASKTVVVGYKVRELPSGNLSKIYSPDTFRFEQTGSSIKLEQSDGSTIKGYMQINTWVGAVDWVPNLDIAAPHVTLTQR